MVDIQSKTKLSRLNSSEDYTNLLGMYKDMHKASDGMFNGRSLLKFVDIIKAYLEANECKSILDYGCGKGILYSDNYDDLTNEIDSPLHKHWNLDDYELFDPAYEEHSKLPVHKKDAVICTDVLEHVAEDDLDWVVTEIFSYAKKIVFLNIACFEALKTLSDGRNAHISVFNPNDWLQFLANKSRDFKHLKIYLFADTVVEDEKGDKEFSTVGYRIDQYPRIVQLRKEEEC